MPWASCGGLVGCAPPPPPWRQQQQQQRTGPWCWMGGLRQGDDSLRYRTTSHNTPCLLLTASADDECRCDCCVQEWLWVFLLWSLCLQQCVHERDRQAFDPPPPTSYLWALSLCPLPHQTSSVWPKKYGRKYLSFLKRGIFSFTKQQFSKFLQCFSVVQSFFFFFPKRERFDQTFFVACGSKIKQSLLFFFW